MNPIQKKTHHHTRIANMLKCSRILSNSVYKDIQVGAILKRIPIVTKSLTPYEKDYYEYKQGLYNRMAIDFPKDYYYPPGTMKTMEFDNVQKTKPNMELLKKYESNKELIYKDNKYVEYNDNGRQKTDVDHVVLVEDVKSELIDESAKKNTDNEVTFNSRVTKADKENNLTKLDRSLENDLYLIVKEQNKWVFPTFKNNEEAYKQLVKDNKSLDLLSVSNLIELGGENMQLWSISKTPCKLLNNTFYFKSIIFSGEFKNDKVEHKWLNKKELKNVLNAEYYKEMEYLLN